MKNNAFFKTLAILLCAVSLFGMVASITGMVALAESDLYNKTVDQMFADKLHNDGIVYADYLARRYASEHLGGVPESMVEDQLGGLHWFYQSYDPAYYGYAILDAEGQELSGYNVDLKDSPNLSIRESFPVVGSYMHIVSLESREDAQDALRQGREEIYQHEPILTLYDNDIPAEGVTIGYAAFTADNGELVLDAYYNGTSTIVTAYTEYGERTFFYNQNQVGLLMLDQTRHLVFHSFFTLAELLPDHAIQEVFFRSDTGELNLRLRSEAGNVGTLYCSTSGNVRFLSAQAAVSPQTEETVPPTTAETVPPTIPETVPPTVPGTVPVENQVQETWVEQTWPSSASALPAETWTVPPTVAATVPPTLPPETLPPETLPPETLPPETAPPTEETLPPATEPELINGKPVAEYQINSLTYWDSSTGKMMDADYIYLSMPEMTVELYLEENAPRYAPLYNILRTIQPLRNYLLPAAIIFFLLFALMGVYLVGAAGRKPKQAGIRAGGLNRLPLDLYFLAGGSLICGLVAAPIAAANLLIKTDFLLFCGVTTGAVFLACLIFVGFCFALAAQCKTGGSYVWKNSLCARFLRLLVLVAVGLEQFLAEKFLPVLFRLLRKTGGALKILFAWLWDVIKAGLGILFRGFHRFLQLLPLTWQWFVGGFLLVFIAILGGSAGGVGMMLGICLCIIIVLYVSHCFGILADSTRRMGQGDLDTKVDDTYLLGCFKDCATDLNALADVAVVAAQKQLKSERMKTELITNVSHDIKTPLTSIINYVYLLQKPHTPEEQEQYLEVLDRQSQRLKKLIDDLMDMSKANTGNMTVEITCLDAVESVNQALGEFADKLETAHLYPVFRHSVASAPILADGKLVWRVLSNLLGNAVKYAMPGTRLYIDLMCVEGKVILSMKNISREELNVDAEELMERFVRGDDSRNTEGSGLGLNITKSLMELQKGQLQLLVDGDLFKVTLTFPGA